MGTAFANTEAENAVADALDQAKDAVAEATDNLIRMGEKKSVDAIANHWSVSYHTSCVNLTNVCTWHMEHTWTAIHANKWNEVTGKNFENAIFAWKSVQHNDEAAMISEARIRSYFDATLGAVMKANSLDGWKSSETALDAWKTNMANSQGNWPNTEWS